MYSLRRESDGAGDSGSLSLALWLDKNSSEMKHEHNARPRVGVAMRVGTPFSRTYYQQDWWQTTLITEILEEKENYVRFRTNNSIYEWTC